MTIPYMRGWIGLVLFLVGIGMMFLPQTKSGAFLVFGFGMGMMASGFKVM